MGEKEMNLSPDDTCYTSQDIPANRADLNAWLLRIALTPNSHRKMLRHPGKELFPGSVPAPSPERESACKLV